MRAEKRAGRARAQDADRHVGARMRERPIMLGLTQQQMAELIGVTYQQAHKYEKGINRVAAGRLYTIAGALGVDVGYFFEGLGESGGFKPNAQQRMLLELARTHVDRVHGRERMGSREAAGVGEHLQRRATVLGLALLVLERLLGHVRVDL